MIARSVIGKEYPPFTVEVEKRWVLSLSARFVPMAYPGDVIISNGRIAGKREESGEKLVDVDFAAQNQKGETIQSDKATVVFI